MIWMAWRQFRLPVIAAAIGLAAVAVMLVITGPHLHHAYQDYAKALATCASNGTCDTVGPPHFSKVYTIIELLDPVILALPVVIGAFWGAPLVAREFESGTWRLAWTQGVTRRRWLATKLGVLGVASAATVGLLTLMYRVWAAPVDTINKDRFQPSHFGQHGVAPMAYALFAFALAVLAGTVIRRTLPAMATTAVAFIAARMAVTYALRSHLLSAKEIVTAIGNPGIGFRLSGGHLSVMGFRPDLPGAWVLSNRVVDNAGQAPTDAFLRSVCPGIANPPPPGASGRTEVKRQTVDTCIHQISLRYHEVTTYHPASRFWTLQVYESAVFLAATAALIAFSFWWTDRRLT